MGGWNAVAECAYLRRLLSELAPDLVIQVLVSNDLDDQMGARGFGGLAAFAPLLPARLSRDPDMVLSRTDGHWSRKGHEAVARLFFALIRRRELLPELALTPWAEAEGQDFAEVRTSWHEDLGSMHEPEEAARDRIRSFR